MLPGSRRRLATAWMSKVAVQTERKGSRPYVVVFVWDEVAVCEEIEVVHGGSFCEDE